jgi:hypothetical protein
MFEPSDTRISFAQNSRAIVGVVLDGNIPLIYLKIKKYFYFESIEDLPTPDSPTRITIFI